MGQTPSPTTPTNGYFFFTARYQSTDPSSRAIFRPLSFRTSVITKASFFILETYALTEDKHNCAYRLNINSVGAKPYEACLSYDYSKSFLTYNLQANTEVSFSLESMTLSKLINLKLWIMIDSECFLNVFPF